MVDREGREKPSVIAPLLIWQQPHPIYFAELVWRQRPGPQTLEEWREIVFETAAFMTAARLGEPGLAVDALLMDRPRNRYLKNGHNVQRPDDLRVYLPGNGALLAAVAMMAAGWDGAPAGTAPGFPADDRWAVRAEGLRRLP
jgi:hypothetical protein